MTETNYAGVVVRLFEPKREEIIREASPPASPRQLMLSQVKPSLARRYVAAWHSRLPDTQVGPWRLAMTAHLGADVYAAALWHNPSARTLPDDWLELRRLVCAPDAPHCTASWMLSAMARWIHRVYPDCPRLISYQDIAVHRGIIYKAAGWTVGNISKPRHRDRSGVRYAGMKRGYRLDLNGASPAMAAKVRWEKLL